MFKRLFTCGTVLGAAAMAPPALAQGAPCFERGLLVETLTTGYAESLSGAGLRSPQQMLELWSSPETGTFTLFITRPDGIACVLASGRDWHQNVTPLGDRVSW